MWPTEVILRVGCAVDNTIPPAGILTSPQPFAEATRLSAKLMEPPPFPFWVERLPERMAVSEAVKGA